MMAHLAQRNSTLVSDHSNQTLDDLPTHLPASSSSTMKPVTKPLHFGTTNRGPNQVKTPVKGTTGIVATPPTSPSRKTDTDSSPRSIKRKRRESITESVSVEQREGKIHRLTGSSEWTHNTYKACSSRRTEGRPDPRISSCSNPHAGP